MSSAPARNRAARLAAIERRPLPHRDCLAAPIVLAVLRVIESCTAAKLHRYLGGYSPGTDRLDAVLRALVGAGELLVADRFEETGGLPAAVPVYFMEKGARHA